MLKSAKFQFRNAKIRLAKMRHAKIPPCKNSAMLKSAMLKFCNAKIHLPKIRQIKIPQC